MTREEAIHFAVCLKNNWTIDFNDMEEFCNIAIESLSADTVSREQYDHVCEEYNRLVHKAVCIKLCDENCEYEKGKTCYHAREHSAIESLSAETSTVQVKHQLSEVDISTFNKKHQLSDLISRADAIEAVASRDETDGTVKVFTGRQVNEILSTLPSVEPVKHGEWIEDIDCEGKTRTITCSKCGWAWHSWVDFNFCPNCGANMRERIEE